MNAAEELLWAAERLAEAVEEHLEVANECPPQRIEFDSGEEGDAEFREAVEIFLEDQESARAFLRRALRDYRHLEQFEPSARAVNGSL
jgi:hypothetical protein